MAIQADFVSFWRQLKSEADQAALVAFNMNSASLDEFQQLYLETLLGILELESENETYSILQLQENNNTYVCIRGLFPPRDLSEQPALFLTLLSKLKKLRLSEIAHYLRTNPEVIHICNVFTLMYSFMTVYALHVQFVSGWNVSLDSVASYMNDTLPLSVVVYSLNLDVAKNVYLFYKHLYQKPDLGVQGKEFVMAPTFQGLVFCRQWPTVSLEIDLFIENSTDKYDFYSRFIETHAHYYSLALNEIQSGKKKTHWIWYMFPTPPYVVNGQEKGSATNQHYALRDRPDALTGDRAALAYLLYPTTNGINLRAHLIELTAAVLQQLERGTPALVLLGEADVPKLRSCMKWFQSVTSYNIDPVVHELCTSVLVKL